jgi:hypothetical protein
MAILGLPKLFKVLISPKDLPRSYLNYLGPTYATTNYLD